MNLVNVILAAGFGTRMKSELPKVMHPLLGRPMIEWCPTNVKREMSVWPPPVDEQALVQRLKKVFDPQGILAPGRFMGGI